MKFDILVVGGRRDGVKGEMETGPLTVGKTTADFKWLCLDFPEGQLVFPVLSVQDGLVKLDGTKESTQHRN